MTETKLIQQVIPPNITNKYEILRDILRLQFVILDTSWSDNPLQNSDIILKFYNVITKNVELDESIGRIIHYGQPHYFIWNTYRFIKPDILLQRSLLLFGKNRKMTYILDPDSIPEEASSDYQFIRSRIEDSIKYTGSIGKPFLEKSLSLIQDKLLEYKENTNISETRSIKVNMLEEIATAISLLLAEAPQQNVVNDTNVANVVNTSKELDEVYIEFYNRKESLSYNLDAIKRAYKDRELSSLVLNNVPIKDIQSKIKSYVRLCQSYIDQIESIVSSKKPSPVADNVSTNNTSSVREALLDIAKDIKQVRLDLMAMGDIILHQNVRGNISNQNFNNALRKRQETLQNV